MVDSSVPETEAASPHGTGLPAWVPPLQPDQVKQSVSLFEDSNLDNGVMSGTRLFTIFSMTRLLIHLWFYA